MRACIELRQRQAAKRDDLLARQAQVLARRDQQVQRGQRLEQAYEQVLRTGDGLLEVVQHQQRRLAGEGGHDALQQMPRRHVQGQRDGIDRLLFVQAVDQGHEHDSNQAGAVGV